MKKVLFASAVTALLVGCSSEEFPQVDNAVYTNVSKVNISVSPYLQEENNITRTSLTPDGNGNFIFNWSEGDVIGTFPISPVAGSQVSQVLGSEEGSDGLSFVFDGGAWQLRKGNSYAAYSPFNGEMKLSDTYSDVPVNMIGQSQTGDASTAHIGAYDYMYALPSTVDQITQTVSFQFEHITGILALDLQMPAAADLDKVLLTTETPMFVTKAKMDVVNGTFEYEDEDVTDEIELGLSNVSSTAGGHVKFYVSVLPTTNEQKKVITVTVVDKNSNVYTGSLREIKVKSGYAYDRDAVLVKSSDEYDNLDYVDLGTNDGVLWGKYNVNISGGSSVEYYSWADVETKTDYSLDGYDPWDGDGDFYYATPNDDDQIHSMVKEQDDVAYMSMKPDHKWRIPTSEEMQHLVDRCTWEWTTIDGVKGYKVSHATKPYRYIFIPANGYMNGTVNTGNNSVGYYWTTDLNMASTNWCDGYCLKISEGDGPSVSTIGRQYGLTIRPVYNGQ